jgi:hypothetical protein
MVTPGQFAWIKGSTSYSTGACVELASHGSMIVMRDSKMPDVHLSFTGDEMKAFIGAAKLGEFDHLIDR